MPPDLVFAPTFTAEADMLAPLVERVGVLAGSPPGELHSLFEIQSATGIPDIVLVVFDETEMGRRRQRDLPPLINAPDVAVMTVLGGIHRQAPEASLTPTALARATGLTASYLSSVIL